MNTSIISQKESALVASSGASKNRRESLTSLNKSTHSKHSNYVPGNKTSKVITRSNRKKQKQEKLEYESSSNEISMEKITYNLKQTEQALREFHSSFKNHMVPSVGNTGVYNSGTSKQNLITAESSTQSLLPTGFPLHFQSHKALVRGNSLTNGGKLQLKSRASSSNSNSSSSSSSKDNSSDGRINDQQQIITDEEGFSPSICSERQITQSIDERKKEIQQSIFSYEQEDKENQQIHINLNLNQHHQFLNQNSNNQAKQLLQCEEKQSVTPSHNNSAVSDSFRVYLETKQGQNSQAIAGAMRALQRKIKSLEQENHILKECFNGIQNKCVTLEQQHQDQRQQTLEMLKQQINNSSNQNSARSLDRENSNNSQSQQQQQQQVQQNEVLMTEIETLQQQVNSLKEQQQTVSETRQKYKVKCNQLQLIINDLQLKLEQNTNKFNSQRQEYQEERQNLISQFNDLQKQNEELKDQNSQKDKEIDALKKQVENSKSHSTKKLQRYKKQIHELRRDLKILEQSHQLSQKALKHTEQFVDEVVHVNDQLVTSLTKNKQRLRSLSNSSRRSGRSHHLYMTNDSIKREDSLTRDQFIQIRHTGSLATTPSHAYGLFPQTTMLSNINQSNILSERDTIQQHLTYLKSVQTTAQKPPKSSRNAQRQFSFSKAGTYLNSQRQQSAERNNMPTQAQMVSLSLDQRGYSHIHSQQQSLETSRFHDEPQVQTTAYGLQVQPKTFDQRKMSQRSLSRSNNKSQRSQSKGRQGQNSATAIIVSNEFTLQPYEQQINNVSKKIEMIEKDLENIRDEYKKTVKGEQYLQNKQGELRKLKDEHDTLVKTIKEKSLTRIKI